MPEIIAYQFEGLTVDLVERELVRTDDPDRKILLRNEPFELLVFLIKHAGRWLSAEELWRGIRVKPTDDRVILKQTITQDAYEIRKALGEAKACLKFDIRKRKRRFECAGLVTIYAPEPDFPSADGHPSRLTEATTKTPPLGVTTPSPSPVRDPPPVEPIRTPGLASQPDQAAQHQSALQWRRYPMSPVHPFRVPEIDGNRDAQLGEEPDTTATLAPRNRYTRRIWLFAATTLLLLGCLATISWRRNKSADDVLIIGLARFSPDSSQAEILRQRIKAILENREAGGPKVEVKLLNSPLDARRGEMFAQASRMAGRNVHVVLGGAAVSATSYSLRFVVVNRFGGLVPNSYLPSLSNAPPIEMLTERGNLDYGPATNTVEDYIKILYALHLVGMVSLDKAIDPLRGLSDHVLGTALMADIIRAQRQYGSNAYALHSLATAYTLVNDMLATQKGLFCLPNSLYLTSLCLAVRIRADQWCPN